MESAGQGDSFNLLGPDESFDNFKNDDNFKQRGTAEFNPFMKDLEESKEEEDVDELEDSNAQLDV